jgi:serine/threonine-protein kinase
VKDGKLEPGDVVGDKYRVQKILGAGGMGIVCRAHDTALGRPVAIKHLLPKWANDEQCVARFLREARAAVRLASEHSVRVFDVGQLPGGIPYMVMEYLDGEDLDSRIKARGPLPPAEAARWILEACEALAEAHAAGVIHRDLKPSNLFIVKRPGGELLKVLDFGLAKMATGEAPLTATTATLGSPLYLSPEQLGRARDVDVRTDVWSLGVSLYEITTGRLPFVAKSVPEIFVAILKETPIAPDRYRPMPAELSAAILRCLEKDPKARFRDVAQLAYALEPIAGTSGVADRVTTILETTQPFVRAGSDPPSGDTKTTAFYDSGPDRARARRIVWTALSVVALGVAIAATLLALRHRAQKVEVATLPLPVPVGAPAQADAAPSDGVVIGASPSSAPAASGPKPPSKRHPHTSPSASANPPTPALDASSPFDHP